MYPVIKIPYLNPLRFHNEASGKFSFESISDFESPAAYCQKFVSTDTIKFQVLLLKDQYVDFKYRILDAYGNEIHEFSPSSLGIYGTLYDVFGPELSDDIISYLEEGKAFYIQISVLTTGGEETETYTNYISEPITLLGSTDNTLLLEYTNNANRFDMAFIPDPENPSEFETLQLRVEGGKYSDGFTPASKDVFYIDQQHDTILLDSYPFVTSKFTFGDGKGIPNWMASKINMIFSLSSVMVNSRHYVKSDGAKLEATREKGYPFAGWQIELIEPESNFSLIDETMDLPGDFNNDFNEDYF